MSGKPSSQGVAPRPFGSGRKHGGGLATQAWSNSMFIVVHRPTHSSSSASRIRGVYSR